MTDNNPIQLEKPTPPGDGECCESGVCDPCVWDFYYKELQQWRIKQSELNAEQQDAK
ncbi:oxidoreductase-like domain-containing protein [Thalassotalea sp. PS06]|uniref:oxidoreductase-like domain-containing protein n=1 Tax=Thalassotalea sp. PS06 TaxID=2594005 RepID=UPI00163DB960|nr:oxidoreductase-like domain-containing protein [Thalassotalea sp. PS06]